MDNENGVNPDQPEVGHGDQRDAEQVNAELVNVEQVDVSTVGDETATASESGDDTAAIGETQPLSVPSEPAPAPVSATPLPVDGSPAVDRPTENHPTADHPTEEIHTQIHTTAPLPNLAGVRDGGIGPGGVTDPFAAPGGTPGAVGSPQGTSAPVPPVPAPPVPVTVSPVPGSPGAAQPVSAFPAPGFPSPAPYPTQQAGAQGPYPTQPAGTAGPYPTQPGAPTSPYPTQSPDTAHPYTGPQPAAIPALGGIAPAPTPTQGQPSAPTPSQQMAQDQLPGTVQPSAQAPVKMGRVIVAAVIAAALVSALVSGIVSHFARPGVGTPVSLNTASSQETDPPPVTNSSETAPDWPAVAAAVKPSVVSIQVENASGEAQGSGLVVDTDGHILTNNHVVEGAQQDKVLVTLTDGRVFESGIVGLDPTTDLAIVKLPDTAAGIPPVAMGDSSTVQVGDAVMAVGNPLGLANTVTTGVVSAINRPVDAGGSGTGTTTVTNAIQIDAAINPGNSGGPVFNAQGQVIGISSSIATMTVNAAGQGGSIGLGFAIPVNLARSIGDQLIANGVAQHAFLGVTMTPGIATADGVTRRGAVIASVSPGSPADKAGLRVDDVIVAFNDLPATGAESVAAYVRERSANDPVTLLIVRDGHASEVHVTLAVRDETPAESVPVPSP